MAMEEFLTLSEVKELLRKEKEERGELSPDQGYALQHADAFGHLAKKKVLKLVKELLDLDFVSPPLAAKLADLLPTQPEEVRAVFSKERFTPGKEETEQILDIVSKYI